jgi:uncharacterized cupin superfamily protein
MKQHITFHRVGAGPGRKPELVAVPWQPTDVPLSDGMNPTGCQFYANPSGKIASGIWACNAGNVEIKDNPVEEICFITQGTVKVTDSRGRSETFGVGECLVLPRGFNGLWSQSDSFAKFYVIIDES